MSALKISGNRYVLHDVLGQGGMGVVYRAYDRLYGRFVALKSVRRAAQDLLVYSSPTGDPHYLLAREFQTLAGLRHPHIIKVLDYGFDTQRQPYFTMTLIPHSQTILDASATLDWQGKTRLLIQLLQGLAYLHRGGIFHSDLKPANVLVNEHNTVKIVDFGLAREKTQSNEVFGTVAYMAPEMLAGADVSVAADLYAAGVLGYECLSGKRPFNKPKPHLLIKDILETPPDLTPLPPALASVLGRLLQKHPHERYADAAAAIEALSVALGENTPPENRTIRESFLQAAKFIGREAELEQLSAALGDALAGKGGAWLVGGESGVGKSRLLDELRIHGLVGGALVLRGRAVDGGSLAYDLWQEVVRRLALSTELTDLDAGIIKEIVPDIETLLERPIPNPPAISGEQGRQRLTFTLGELFKRQEQPILLLLEDLQWAGESLELLKGLLPLATKLPLFIVGNYRDDEAPHLPQDLPQMRLITLPRFDKENTARLCQAILGSVAGQVVDRMMQETEGNVFFLVEVMRALAEEAGQLSEIGRVALPERVFAGGVQAVVERRLAAVPDWGKYPLCLAAVGGRALNLDLLRHILPEKVDLEAWLTVCAAAAVLNVQDERWQFAHDKLREGILAQFSPIQHIHFNREMALAIEELYPDDPIYARLLMEHWRMAGEPEKEAVYARRACFYAYEISAYKDALRFGERTLALQTHDDLPLLIRLAEICWYLSSYATGNAYANAALEMAERDGDTLAQVEALTVLGDIAAQLGQLDAGNTLMTRALALIAPLENAAVRCKVYYTYGFICMWSNNPNDGIYYTKRSLELARQTQNHRLELFSFNNLGIAAFSQGDSETALRYYEGCMQVADRLGHPFFASAAIQNIGEMHRLTGDYEQAITYYQKGHRLTIAAGTRDSNTLYYLNMALVTFAQQNYPRSAQYFLYGLNLALKSGRTPNILECVTGFAGLKASQGDYATAAAWLGCALSHPLADFNVTTDAKLFTTYVQQYTTPEAYQNGYETGKTLDLDAVVAQIKTEFAWAETTESLD